MVKDSNQFRVALKMVTGKIEKEKQSNLVVPLHPDTLIWSEGQVLAHSLQGFTVMLVLESVWPSQPTSGIPEGM